MDTFAKRLKFDFIDRPPKQQARVGAKILGN
jgi:hypothetical protein